MAQSQTHTKVIVVGGGGTMGSSTALHLLRSGYTPSNITVLDEYPIPSAQSAGYDLNKIMSIRLRNKVDLQLSLEALDMWKNDDLFKPFFHNVGMVSDQFTPMPIFSRGFILTGSQIDCSSSEDGIANLRKKLQSLIDANVGLGNTNFWLGSEEEILQKLPQFTKEQVKVKVPKSKSWEANTE